MVGGALVFEVYTAESVSLFASSTTFPTDLKTLDNTRLVK